mgnify:FL=1
MSLPPYRQFPPQPPEPSPATTYQLPPATTSPPVKRTAGSYLNLSLWRALLLQAARHRYWLKGAAIAYGIACCLLFGGLAVLATATLNESVSLFITVGLTQWLPDLAPTVRTLVTQTQTEWQLWHRWGLLLVTASLGLSLWLKVVGLAQQIIRSDGDLASHLVPSLRQRLTTIMVAGVSAGLTLLALGCVLMALPASLQGATESPLFNLVQRLFAQVLRWCLTASTMALVFGLLYRTSQKSSARATPILPGTVFATSIWLLTAGVFRLQLGSVMNHHWLYSMMSIVLLSQLVLYCCTMGLLLGGQYNKLVHRYFPQSRSHQAAAQVPPPSFDSFTIQKPP